MATKILLIEDEPGVQMTLEDRLSTEGWEVEIRGDGLEGEKEARKGIYDLILLDVMLPGRDGFGVCRNLRKAEITTPILMLTARGTDLDTITGLREGADDYLSKPFDMGVLLARIEALLRRAEQVPAQINTDPEKIQFGTFSLDIVRGLLFQGKEEIPLNAQEFRLLEFMGNRPENVISRDTLLDEVWGYGAETSSRTVDVHIAKLRQKLGESELPHHILTIRGRGYKFSL